MKIFILGMPESCRTTVAKALCQEQGFTYIDSYSWIKNSFRPQRSNEHPEQYLDEYHHWYLNRLKEKNLNIDFINGIISCYQKDSNWVIDGINNPHDFTNLFDYNKDFVVFLNRTDNQDSKSKDYESIGISVIRDYCFWLSSAGLLSKHKWYEYNFKLIGGSPDRFKAMGSKNSVFILGSIEKVIDHLKQALILG